MKLSIVTTLYKSQEYVEEFYRRSSIAARKLVGEDFEIIFVNDGSPDRSLSLAVELSDNDSKVVTVDLSRNFGHHKAMMAGLSYAQGELIYLIDSDLEESPEWIGNFFEVMVDETADTVFGVQGKRRGGIFDRFTGWLFYRLFRTATGIPQPDNVVTARLMSRNYVDALLQHREREINIGGLWIITGFHQVPVKVDKVVSSPTTYSPAKKISNFVNAITAFSSLPLVLIFYLGLVITLSAVGFSGYLMMSYFANGSPVEGYLSTIVSIWFFSGLITLFQGIQGIYLAKIFSEVKQRPNTIVRKVYRA